MALVSYSDSEGSDSEEQARSTAAIASKKELSSAYSDTNSTKPGQGFSPLVDRGNPGKIRVALPEIKPESEVNGEGEDGPARKKSRTNGDGRFSGFNSMLPAPKRNNQSAPNASKAGAPRKAVSLKTGAAPGFDRQADAELRQEHATRQSTSDDTIPKPGSLRDDGPKDAQLLKEENYKKKGNAMLFKPLSVARTGPKKKSAALVAASKVTPSEKKTDSSTETAMASAQGPSLPAAPYIAPEAPPKKPKVSLFSFSSDDKTTSSQIAETSTQSSSGYESLLYKPSSNDDVSVSQEDASFSDAYGQQAVGSSHATSSQPQQQPTLDTIADDLNLSRSQRRQLMGRNSQALLAKSRVRTFETDAEYAANQEMLNRTSQEEIAAQQHNPVRAIAPGKHSLQQLVQAASSQRDALEESFASGRRNKKEAGSKYGW
jgi:hypothetical protein